MAKRLVRCQINLAAYGKRCIAFSIRQHNGETGIGGGGGGGDGKGGIDDDVCFSLHSHCCSRCQQNLQLQMAGCHCATPFGE